MLQFYNVTQSTATSTALTALVFVLLIFGIINQVTTASRQLWSFARDDGLPWSGFLSRVEPSEAILILSFSLTRQLMLDRMGYSYELNHSHHRYIK